MTRKTESVVRARESDLYGPVKQHLEGLGYTVRGEVGRCDVVAVSGDAIVAVELKLTFGLPVLYQALQRLPSVDLVYVAVAVPEGHAETGMLRCRMRCVFAECWVSGCFPFGMATWSCMRTPDCPVQPMGSTLLLQTVVALAFSPW